MGCASRSWSWRKNEVEAVCARRQHRRSFHKGNKAIFAHADSTDEEVQKNQNTKPAMLLTCTIMQYEMFFAVSPILEQACKVFYFKLVN